MKVVNWAHYSWELKNLAPSYPAVLPPYSLRRAVAEDLFTVRTVILSAFTLDSEWNSFLGEIRPVIEASLATAGSDEKKNKEPLCLLVTHGSRIIGASVLSTAPDAENHLLTGPCLSMEYRNRGLATALLAESLLALREAGLSTARGITKHGSTAAQFIYSKFGSTRQKAE